MIKWGYIIFYITKIRTALNKLKTAKQNLSDGIFETESLR